MTEAFPGLEAPPPYPSAFALPPYETVTSLDTWADSYCLPPYQFRTAQRFHPYLRIFPNRRGRQEESFEQFLRSLQACVNDPIAPPVAAEAPSIPSMSPCLPVRSTNNQASVAAALPAPGPPPPAPFPAAQGPNTDPIERSLSVVRRLFLLPEFIRIVRSALCAAIRAVEVQKQKMITAARQ